jgi:hypothetical protein
MKEKKVKILATKPIKVSFLARAGGRLRLPKGKMTKPVKVSFLTRRKVAKRMVEK